MVEFHCNWYHPGDHTPIVSDRSLEEYAEALLQDYNPALLKEPGKINAFQFVEGYLGATVEVQDIYYEKTGSPIAGATVFNDDYIRVFDRENMCTKTIAVKAGTIIIDCATIEDGPEGYSAFTILHEGGHFCLHKNVYKRRDDRENVMDCVEKKPVVKQSRSNTPCENSSFHGSNEYHGSNTSYGSNESHRSSKYHEHNESYGNNQSYGNSQSYGYSKSHIICCRRSSIEENEGKELYTQEDFREHQANVVAAGIAMPRPTFIPYAKELIRKCGFNDGIWVDRNDMPWEAFAIMDCAFQNLLDNISETFGVSKKAATVQLKRQGLLMTEAQYRQKSGKCCVAV